MHLVLSLCMSELPQRAILIRQVGLRAIQLQLEVSIMFLFFGNFYPFLSGNK